MPDHAVHVNRLHAVTHNEGGWDCDESPQELGTRFQLPEQFEDRREEIFSKLEPING